MSVYVSAKASQPLFHRVDLNWRLGAWIDRKIRSQKSYHSVFDLLRDFRGV